MTNCLIAGVGGQGTILLSRLIGAAALKSGLPVRGTETIGMAQRGGSVVSHVRMGEGAHSPLIPPGTADIIIAFEPGEAVRALPYLAENGLLIACDRAVKPVTSSLSGDNYSGREMAEFISQNVGNSVLVDGERLLSQLQSPRFLNVALLGAAVSCGRLPFTGKTVLEAMEERIKPQFMDANRLAFEIGAAMAGQA